jgi:methyl-accepting chemotaxis protein
MLEFARNIRIKTFCNVLIAAMIFAGGVIAYAAYSTIQEVNNAKSAWDAYDTGAARRTRILSDLKDVIGYGGLVHNFKNAVIRRDPQYLDRINQTTRLATELIAQFRATQLSAKEVADIATIEKVINEYISHVPKLKDSIAQNSSIEQIDKATRVGDVAAVAAFNNLDEALRGSRQSAETKIYSTVSKAQDYTYLTVTTVAILILALIVLFLWFAQSRLIRPIYALMEFVNRVGNGDLTKQMTDVSEDEVGTLCKRLNEMVANLKDITVQTRSAVNNLNSAAAETLASTKQQAASVAEQFAALQETTATVDEISQSGEQMSVRAKDIASQAEKASERSKDGLRSMDDLAKVMDAIEEQTEAVAEHIVALSEKTQAIGDIIATVRLSMISPSDRNCWRSTLRSRRPRPANKGAASRSSPKRSRPWPTRPRPRPRRSRRFSATFRKASIHPSCRPKNRSSGSPMAAVRRKTR